MCLANVAYRWFSSNLMRIATISRVVANQPPSLMHDSHKLLDIKIAIDSNSVPLLSQYVIDIVAISHDARSIFHMRQLERDLSSI